MLNVYFPSIRLDNDLGSRNIKTFPKSIYVSRCMEERIMVGGKVPSNSECRINEFFIFGSQMRNLRHVIESRLSIVMKDRVGQGKSKEKILEGR